MREAGYEITGADPRINFSGVMPWHGSLREVEQRAKQVAKRRAQAEADLNSALMDDEARDAKEAEQKQLRDCFNAMRVRHSADPNAPGLVVWMGGAPLTDESVLTPLQQRAIQWARATLATTP
jgi:hypothetical protein